MTDKDIGIRRRQARFAAGPGATSVVLAAFGVGGVVGNVASGWAGDRIGSRRAVVLGAASCVVLVAALAVLASAVVVAVVLVAVWSVAYAAVMPAVTRWLVDLAPADPGLLLPVGSSAIYLGRGCGGLLGGLVLDGWGISAVTPGAAVLAAAALAVALTRPAPREIAAPPPRPSAVDEEVDQALIVNMTPNRCSTNEATHHEHTCP